MQGRNQKNTLHICQRTFYRKECALSPTQVVYVNSSDLPSGRTRLCPFSMYGGTRWLFLTLSAMFYSNSKWPPWVISLSSGYGHRYHDILIQEAKQNSSAAFPGLYPGAKGFLWAWLVSQRKYPCEFNTIQRMRKGIIQTIILYCKNLGGTFCRSYKVFWRSLTFFQTRKIRCMAESESFEVVMWGRNSANRKRPIVVTHKRNGSDRSVYVCFI